MNKKTQKFLTFCAKAGYERIAIETKDKAIPETLDMPFGVEGCVFAWPDKLISPQIGRQIGRRKMRLVIQCGNGLLKTQAISEICRLFNIGGLSGGYCYQRLTDKHGLEKGVYFYDKKTNNWRL